MYKTGDHVFYPKGGVFVVEKESDKKIGGHNVSFYDLVSNDGKTRISIPRANVDRVGVRRLLSVPELQTEMDDWSPDLKISKLHHKNRKSRFEALRQTGDFKDMGTVVVTIHYLINKMKATFEEKRMYDQIRKRMINEIGIVHGWSENRAEANFQESLDQAIVRKAPASHDEDVVDSIMEEEQVLA